jgi:hypothetical protein
MTSMLSRGTVVEAALTLVGANFELDFLAAFDTAFVFFFGLFALFVAIESSPEGGSGKTVQHDIGN